MLPGSIYSKGYVPFHPEIMASGYKLCIKPECLHFLDNRIQSDHISQKLIKKILGLRSDPRPVEGGAQHKHNHQRHRVVIDGIVVTFDIESGCVCINDLNYNSSAKHSHELPGLHVVEKVKNAWVITDEYVTEVKTEYAAVNGQSNNRAQASENVMPLHVLDAYGPKITKFTLFHNPTEGAARDTFESFRDKVGLTNSMTKSFAKVLEKAQDRGQEVKWVAHSQGGAIFAEGVRKSFKTNGKKLDKHTICFQGMANNRLRTDFILKKAGVKLHEKHGGYNANPLDAVPQVIGLNALTDVMIDRNFKSIARLALAPIALVYGLPMASAGGPNLSPHTKPYEGLPAYAKQAAPRTTGMLSRIVRKFV